MRDYWRKEGSISWVYKVNKRQTKDERDGLRVWRGNFKGKGRRERERLCVCTNVRDREREEKGEGNYSICKRDKQEIGGKK